MKSIFWMAAACLFAGSSFGATVSTPPPYAPTSPLSPPDATPPRPGVSLAAAVEAAWQRAVSARETEGQRRQAEARQLAANRLWASAPVLELKHRNDRWQRDTGQQETEVGLAWPLWLPGQRQASVVLADTGLAQAELAQSAARLQLAGQVRETAWGLHAQQAESALADARQQSLRSLADDVERRVRAGDLARADALAAKAELLEATAHQAEARQRLVTARTRWAMLTGLDAPPAIDSGRLGEHPGSNDTRTGDTGTSDIEILAGHPQLRYAALAVEHARHRLELLRVSRRDAPELTLGLRRDVAGRTESAQHSLAIGLRLPFATSDRNQPLQAAALTDLEVAETHAQRLREQLQAETYDARAAVQTAERQLDAERERAALLRERARLIDLSFRAGESPLPDLLRALAAAVQAETALARQHAALGLTRARLQQAFGQLP